MKKSIVLLIVFIVVALIVIPLMLAKFNMPSISTGAGNTGPGRRGGRASGMVFTVRTTDAVVRTLQSYIEVNGNIVSQEQVTVVPEAAGKLVSMNTAIGSTVRKGELIAQVDPSRPGAEYSFSPVYAPVSGMVVSNPVSVGSTVSTTTPLLILATAGSLEIDALIPEREVGQLRTGLPAEVRLEAFPGEVFQAETVKISPVVDPASRTKSVTLRFIREDQRINSGMFARIKLNTRTYENVITIPQDAIVENRGNPAVFVIAGAAGDGTSRVSMKEVSVGVTVDDETEIKSGIAAGDKVVIQGQQFLTDEAAVRVLGDRL